MKVALPFPLILSLVSAELAFAQTKAPPILDYNSRFHPVIGSNGIVASQEARASEVGLLLRQRQSDRSPIPILHRFGWGLDGT